MCPCGVCSRKLRVPGWPTGKSVTRCVREAGFGRPRAQLDPEQDRDQAEFLGVVTCGWVTILSLPPQLPPVPWIQQRHKGEAGQGITPGKYGAGL